ncbi:Flp pilus assembly protein CpaB [Bordetella sp. BOR01]|uniref:Flp pilus assembly protein CpaB n=1 Tax=Bordetella sp. BOR01 TaxID=2854779 RepID=UPI001C48B268|nr:Flp pilus assembly protein CpaB [Bordetella sp. BOR01]MBV7482547.1 Flp pilus assembly protein CpaB [Bordetella sp. BOR01]
MKFAFSSLLPRLRPLSVYAFALAAGLLAAWAAREHIQARVREIEREAEVARVNKLVAATDLPAGTRLQADHLAVRDIPLPWVSSGTFDPDAVDHVVGTVLTTDVRQGDALLDVHLAHEPAATPLSDLVSAGRRAVTLPADEINAASGLLQAGDLIDLYVSFAHRGQHLTAPLLQGVRVLAMSGGVDAAPSITLDASAQDAIKLVAARHSGTLTAMLRHRGDGAAPQSSASGDLAALMGLDANDAVQRPAVPILYGDRLDADLSPTVLEADDDVRAPEGKAP